GAAAVHRAREPLLVGARRPAHRHAAGDDLRLRACALPGLERPGLDRRARAARAGDGALGADARSHAADLVTPSNAGPGPGPAPLPEGELVSQEPLRIRT